jgi:hypothetical protein
MDRMMQALAREGGCQVVRELRLRPGMKHAELLKPLGLTQSNKGQLTKLLAPLEAAGVVTRTDGRYSVVDVEATGRLLTAAADVNVAAQRVLAERARTGVADAERLAEELRVESKPGA